MEKQILNQTDRQPLRANWARGIVFGAIGLAIAAAGIYLGETDDAPGAAMLGILAMMVLLALGVKQVRHKAR